MTGLPTVGADAGTWGTILNAYLTEREVGYGTSLPGSPTDGQRYVLVDSTTAPTYQWEFRYNTGSSSSYKWEFVGGTPMRSFAASVVTTTSLSYTSIDGTTPLLVLPHAGQYIVDFGSLTYNATSGSANYLGLFVGAAVAHETVLTVSGNNFQHWAARRVEITPAASDSVYLVYKVTASTGSYELRHLLITPVRVS